MDETRFRTLLRSKVRLIFGYGNVTDLSITKNESEVKERSQ